MFGSMIGIAFLASESINLQEKLLLGLPVVIQTTALGLLTLIISHALDVLERQA
jgi:hypothetical protein